MHPRDRVRRGKFSDEFWCADPSRGEALSGGTQAGSHVVPRELPLCPAGGGEAAAAGGGPDRAGQRQRDNPRRTVGHTGQGREPLRPGSPSLGRRLVLSCRAETLRCGGSRCCLGVRLPRFLVPGPPLPGEETRGAREWSEHTDIKGIFGAATGICQGDGERADREILLSVFPSLSALH